MVWSKPIIEYQTLFVGNAANLYKLGILTIVVALRKTKRGRKRHKKFVACFDWYTLVFLIFLSVCMYVCLCVQYAEKKSRRQNQHPLFLALFDFFTYYFPNSDFYCPLPPEQKTSHPPVNCFSPSSLGRMHRAGVEDYCRRGPKVRREEQAMESRTDAPAIVHGSLREPAVNCVLCVCVNEAKRSEPRA